MKNWKFIDEPNTAIITLKEILVGKSEITYVTHDMDGAWQFIKNDSKSTKTENATLVGLGEIISLDSSLITLFDLPRGWFAWRDNNKSSWHREKSNGDKSDIKRRSVF